METNGNTINYEAFLADLEAKKAVIENTIAAVKILLGRSISAEQQEGSSSSSGPVQSQGPSQGQIHISSDAFFQMSIPDAAIKYLKMVRKPQGTQAIADALERGGMTHTSKSFYQTVGSSLIRRSNAPNTELVRVKRGEWGMAEWYPGRRKTADTSGTKDEKE